MNNRRDFLKKTAAATGWLTAHGLPGLGRQSPAAATAAPTAPGASPAPNNAPGPLPWYRRVTRWGQVNITEKDPQLYDIAAWREYWRHTGSRGIIANAGGIVAYYPTKIPLHHKAEYLGSRDLFGELCHAAHEDGLAVFARMDSNRAQEEVYQAHPGWFAVDIHGQPYKAADLYIACVNSPYYSEHLPAVLREIATLYHPEGFTDNSWSGLGRDSVCYCGYCRKDFREKTGFDLPTTVDWNARPYKAWIRWNYDRRLELWAFNNQVTRSAGGPDCIWAGMNSGSISGQSRSFRDFRAIARQAEIIMLDDQARTDNGGFSHNGEIGKLIHGILGWDKLIPESMAMYQAGKPTFRVTAKPEAEARLWMIEGLAGGLQLWWHMVSAYREDRRMLDNPTAIYAWEAANEAYLLHRRPVATVGVLWSQENYDLYGREHAGERVELPWRGITFALIRARIPYLPVHADDIDQTHLAVLVLPDLALLSAAQTAALRRFVARGGSLIATGNTGLLDEHGETRPDFPLGDLFGVHLTGPRDLFATPKLEKLAGESWHTYLRLNAGNRHPVLKGFEKTDILPFGGLLDSLRVDAGADIPLTFIPQFPVYPPEKAWMRIPSTDIPGLVLREIPVAGEPETPRTAGSAAGRSARLAYLPADIDRQYGRSNLPDLGDLLRNLVRWAANGDLPIDVQGAGLIDCHLYERPGRLILHLVNLFNENTWRQPLDEWIPVGPLTISVRLPQGIDGRHPQGIDGRHLQLLVAGRSIPAAVGKKAAEISAGKNAEKEKWCHFELPRLLDHEVVVIS